ncbi:hypothetical protein JAAARDRAFT_33479 [Jaapia argillacea MUCL 33604]|uniref:Endonuclease/exonuclease/phosphatase domain-containing protein n=1 Tax=Jaapia argillacea MUCL 33604 TaxID=933084 RepID=A0A067Q197_9AGAM|nr:hypothetical protein JAAARDRAFT_33479 [Jaapia argillacea MUCL 33604]
MSRLMLFIGLLLSSLVTLSSALCIMCPNCDYDWINNTVGAECLQKWTCDDATMRHHCETLLVLMTWRFADLIWLQEVGGGLKSGPEAICRESGGIDSKCVDAKDVYHWGSPGHCIAASGTVSQ